MPSLALSRAPLASWISLILVPPLPMTEPMREFGIMNLIVTARLPGTDALSNGSSLILRTIKPKAYDTRREISAMKPRSGCPEHTFETASRGPLTFKILSGLPGMLSDTMTRAPLFSRISLTCDPPLPMMMDASCVTMRHRMWMLADGGGAVREKEFEGAPERRAVQKTYHLRPWKKRTLP